MNDVPLIHCIVISVLYYCQGLVLGCISILPSLLIDAGAPVATSVLALISLPLYAFSFKFLWSPVVDLYYSRELHNSRTAWKSLHRRAQYVVPLQAIMSAIFAGLAYGMFQHDNDILFLRSIADGSSTTTAVIVFSALALCSATQDVAVDAWAVEGMKDDLHGIAGSLQMAGLILGNASCQVVVILRDIFPLSHLFLWCGLLCFLGGLLALIEGAVAPLPSLDPSPGDLNRPAISLILRWKHFALSDGPRNLFVVLLTRGWVAATNGLVIAKLQSQHVVDIATLSHVKLLSVGASLLTAFFVVPRISGELLGARALRTNSRIDFLISISWLVLLLLTAGDEGGEVLMGKSTVLICVVALSLVTAVIGAISFVAVVQESSLLASGTPSDAGAAITLFNAAANVGYTLPATLLLTLVEPVTKVTQAVLESGGIYFSIGTDPRGGSRHYFSVDIIATTASCALLIFFAFALRRALLVPNVVQLIQHRRSTVKKKA